MEKTLSLSEQKELVEGIRCHALDNYDRGGWDYLVECYDDSDILLEIEGETTLDGAVRVLGEKLGERDDYRRDIQAERF